MIEVENLTKQFGSKRAVDDLTFTVKKGEVLGFLGPNGAGKSTTMRMITGFIPPTSGDARVCGISVIDEPKKAKTKIGYLPESAPLYHDMTVIGFLKFCASVRGLSGTAKNDAVERAIDTCFLNSVARQSIDTLSKGYRHRTCLAQALLHDPEVLILDEPTVGLDPQIRTELWTLIDALRTSGTTILMSTHYIEEAERLADEVALMAGGRIIARASPAELIAEHAGQVTAEVYAPPQRLLEIRRSAEAAGLSVRPAGPAVAIVGIERAGSWDVPEGAIRRASSLEDVFVLLTGEEAE